jgi:hypothetical protein
MESRVCIQMHVCVRSNCDTLAQGHVGYRIDFVLDEIVRKNYYSIHGTFLHIEVQSKVDTLM